jgi:glycine oxidase
METREVLIMGGGIIGMAIALELQQQGAAVTILSQNFAAAAAHAAAGMLAPQAEGLVPGPMRDLCLASRDRYADWSRQLEQLTGEPIGYLPCGILAPAYDFADFPHPDDRRISTHQMEQIQPGLGDEVQGAWWFSEDGQVDNRQMARVLHLALQKCGVEICDGVSVEKIHSDPNQLDRVTHLETSTDDWQAEHYILATGAWSQDLLPIPVVPRKGQMMAVQGRGMNPALNTVLFGSHVYMVPRQDGRIIIGATSENVGFLAGNTIAGVEELISEATRLFPAIHQAEVIETWWGFRPATPDEWPILGGSPFVNLTLATGHYRNGILLTPITGKLIADRVIQQKEDPLLAAFHWSRFR